MDYYECIQKTIDSIESNLSEDIRLDELANEACFSVFHFHRIFRAITGEPVMDYIRKRRLARAASELVDTDKTVIDIAFEYRFNSHEGFTRAFKKAYGITPRECRKTFFRPEPLVAFNALKMKIKFMSGGVIMEPKIVERKEFRIIGMDCRTTKLDNVTNFTIPKLWGRFIPRCEEVTGKSDTKVCYGVCVMEEGSPFTDKTEFSYIAGFEVESGAKPPKGMTEKVLPAAKYAVFTHKGKISDIYKTLDHVYGRWLPNSKYKLSRSAYDFELYDERFIGGDDPKSETDIYVPIM